MNTTIQREPLIQQLNWRYATKQFNSHRKISPENWAALEEALVTHSIKALFQSWRFIVRLVGKTLRQTEHKDEATRETNK